MYGTYKTSSKLRIQVTHFDSLMTRCIATGALPITTLYPEREVVKSVHWLEFYGSGYMKERITAKIISSFELCDPKFLNNLRASILKKRKEVFDMLRLNSYLQYKKSEERKENYLTIFLAECGLKKHQTNAGLEVRRLVEEMDNFVLNFLFVAGCNEFFNSPLRIAVGEITKRNFFFKKCKKEKGAYIESFNLGLLFNDPVISATCPCQVQCN
ncbi:hypothetical protein EIN_052640 [Entamoeba invadens IP1]|uniref:hypothetical protein n=1 Tax=Entamoeba invadens IP1 TaxID=370355 RepID=UPI0002C3F704|nr:hypothetical protein EIN_052640 [Entamoeba invadens IP1]ELP93049.1 hypothetical protein EIN_052640 [Entamoeba invadens IP1]|eukprot:XP_004259820.1 hypothetical protein EIN_052640 [Entamoeba invadens IP1]